MLDSAIARIDGQAADGDVVDLVTDTGKFVARGIYNSHSRIRVRLYTWDAAEALDEAFWRQRLRTRDSPAARAGSRPARRRGALVFSEADGLSGLVVDRYGEWLAVQVTGLGMALRLDDAARTTGRANSARRGFCFAPKRGWQQAEGIELRDGLAWGKAPDGPVFIEENGLRYGVDLAEGQKTGFYLDQRENRRVAAGYFRGRRVLDMFCYSGGFALNAAAPGKTARSHRLRFEPQSDRAGPSQRRAQQPARRPLRGGGLLRGARRACAARATTSARSFSTRQNSPAAAQSLDDALRAYHRLNRLAVDVLEPGGILVTCSCSGHVTREDFLFMLLGVAQQIEARHSDHRTAARRRRPPGRGDLPGERIPQMLHLPSCLSRMKQAVMHQAVGLKRRCRDRLLAGGRLS